MEGVELNIKKSKRKTLSIYIERDGTITVLAPDHLSDAKIDEAIKSKEYLIYKYQAQWIQLNDNKIKREYVNGQSFLYLGRNYRLELVEEQDIPLKLKGGFFLLRKKDVNKAKEHFIQFYKDKIKKKLTDRVKYYQGYLGVSPSGVFVMELQNRWASCTSQGRINFHWKCAMAPVDVLDYIVVHELTHLIHKNHSDEFWNEIDKVMPKYQRHVDWLKLNGASMDV